MPRVAVRRSVTADEAARLLEPRRDLLVERRVGEGELTLASGPFREWHRCVTVGPPGPDGRAAAVETVRFRLAIPVWGVVFVPLVKRAVRQGVRDRPPWWAPPDRLDARAATVLGLLCSVSAVAGYLGTLLSQTNTFFKEDFGATDAAIGATLAAVRIGALLALLVVALADRRGRRRVLVAAGVAGCLVTATGALSPGLVALGVSQTVARAFSTAMALLVSIVAVEETPPGARAYAVSVLTMTGALGAGAAVALLWVADLGVGAWRILYLVPLAVVVPMARLGRHLPETRRFSVSEARGPAGARPRRARPQLGRLALLAASGLCFSLFVAPASAFLNEYLRSDRGFAAGGIIAFQLLTNTPGGLGIIVGGRLADARGRRVVGAIGLAAGVGCTVAMYLTAGWAIWMWSVLGAVLGAMAVPALAVYGPELFPTTARGTANGVINLFSVLGSAAGLAAAGLLADRLAGGLGAAMTVLALGPAVVVLLVLVAYPETVGRRLEELNPEDAPLSRELLALDGLDVDSIPERWVPYHDEPPAPTGDPDGTDAPGRDGTGDPPAGADRRDPGRDRGGGLEQ